jgi:heat shock protein HslJ
MSVIKMQKRIVLLGVLSVSLAACEGLTGPSTSSLQGTWQLVSLQPSAQPQAPAPSGAVFSVEFGSDGRVSVAADCNRCGSTYQADRDTLHVGLMACTLAYCATAPVDTQFSGLVSAAESWSVAGGELELRSAQGTLRLRR